MRIWMIWKREYLIREKWFVDHACEEEGKKLSITSFQNISRWACKIWKEIDNACVFDI